MPLRSTVLDLPPPYTLVVPNGHIDAFAHAQAIAAEQGAGTLVWSRRPDLVAFAVVLEPEETLSAARCAIYPCMTALADAVSAACPPEKAVAFDWPVTLRFDGARIGGGRLAWPAACAEDAVPDWLVFGGMLMVDTLDPAAPGHTPDATSLAEEGFDTDPGSMVESFARHLMSGFETWRERGFKAVARTYLERLPGDDASLRRGIDVNGDLLVDSPAGLVRTPLLDALALPAWYDPESRMPCL
jgi:biotin-(acetyl-CoA carboxylase) ligase